MATLVSIDTSEVTTFLKINLGEKLPKGFNTRKVVTDAAIYIAAYMKVRTLKGRDVDNQAFAPYAESTKKSRSKRGRQVSHVDLFDTGKMQAGIGHRVISGTEAVVAPFDAFAGKKAIIHQLGLGHNPKRKFFGISETDPTATKAIQKIAETELDRALKEI